MMNCLKNIVGVLNNECGCLTQDLNDETLAEIKLSTSGIYLEDLPGFPLHAMNEFDACKDLGQKGLNAIRKAAVQMEDDLLAAIAEKMGQQQNAYLGIIGLVAYAGNLSSVLGTYHGIKLSGVRNSDAVLTLSSFRIVLNVSVDTEVKLIKCIQGASVGTQIGTFPVTTSANSHVIVQTNNLKLPLSENGSALDYYFVYDRMGATPKDNKVDCNCPGMNNGVLKGFIHYHGIYGDNLNMLDSLGKDTYGHGLTLDIEIRCNSAQLFCRNYDSTEAVARVMARAVWYKAGELLIEDVLGSPDVNRYTTMSREHLYGKRNNYKLEYQGRITFLAGDKGVNINDSNCYVCSEEKYIKGTISVTDDEKAYNDSVADHRQIVQETQGGINYNSTGFPFPDLLNMN